MLQKLNQQSQCSVERILCMSNKHIIGIIIHILITIFYTTIFSVIFLTNEDWVVIDMFAIIGFVGTTILMFLLSLFAVSLMRGKK